MPLFPSSNPLVRGLSPDTRTRLELVQLEQFTVVLQPAGVQSHVYFPVGCVASLLSTLEDGTIAQVAMVGQEGMLGMDAFLGGSSRVSHAIALVHTAGPAWRVGTDVFQHELARNFVLQQRLMRYTLALVHEMARTAACRRMHTVEQQVSRWLLQAIDRAPSHCLPIAAESIANLLGLRRDDVALALRRLQRLGLVEDHGDRIAVGARSGLEACGCACHRAMRETTQRALLQERAPAHPVPGRVAAVVRAAG